MEFLFGVVATLYFIVFLIVLVANCITIGTRSGFFPFALRFSLALFTAALWPMYLPLVPRLERLWERRLERQNAIYETSYEDDSKNGNSSA